MAAKQLRIEITPERVYWIEKGRLSEERPDGQQHCRVVWADRRRLFYSKHDRIPEIGDVVKGCNSFGLCEVKGYFHEDGYFGVLMTPSNPPQWFVEQEKRKKPSRAKMDPIGKGNIGLYGSEFEFVNKEAAA
jgi:hypothetical protein